MLGLGARQVAELAAASFRASFMDDAAKARHLEAVWKALAEHEAAAAAAPAAESVGA